MPVLNQRLENMSDAAFYAAVSRLSYGECRTRQRPSTGTQMVPVRICAVDGGQFAGGSNTPPTGVTVARMQNLGGIATERWGLKPGAFESYIVVYGPAPVKYDIVEISTSSPSAPRRVIVSGGVYHHCGHPLRPAGARASFGPCSANPGGLSDPPDRAGSGLVRRGARLLRLVSTANAAPVLSHSGPAWIHCGGDCCTTEAQ